MLPNKVYIDTCILYRWFLWKFYPRKYGKEPKIIRYLSEENSKTRSYVSIITIAELVELLRFDGNFKDKNLGSDTIIALINELQNILNLEIINYKNIKMGDNSFNGIIVSDNIVKFAEFHKEIIDCIHVDIAKSCELCFLTDETKIGSMKSFYNNIMTENKFFKQDFD